MIRRTLPLLAALAAALAPAAAKEARIPFASMVRDFRAEDRHTIYLRAGRDWYRGAFAAPCEELPWAWNLAFDTGPGSSAIDRFATVIARGERCRLSSLVKIEGEPPATAKKPERKKGD